MATLDKLVRAVESLKLGQVGNNNNANANASTPMDASMRWEHTNQAIFPSLTVGPIFSCFAVQN